LSHKNWSKTDVKVSAESFYKKCLGTYNLHVVL